MTDLATLRRALGLPDAQMINEGLKTTVDFFATVIGTEPLLWLDSLRGIDFHHPVSAPWLEKHTTLVRYDKADRDAIGKGGTITPFAFFTDVGVSPFHTGTSWDSWHYKVFNVTVRTNALVSIASTMSWHPFGDVLKPRRPIKFDRVFRKGGGVQYILSRADWPKLLYVSERHTV